MTGGSIVEQFESKNRSSQVQKLSNQIRMKTTIYYKLPNSCLTIIVGYISPNGKHLGRTIVLGYCRSKILIVIVMD